MKMATTVNVNGHALPISGSHQQGKNSPQTDFSPSEVLRGTAAELRCEVTDRRLAQHLDTLDPLKHLRQEYHYPKICDLPKDERTPPCSSTDEEEESIYLCGNSLGLQPRGVRKCIDRELEKWAKYGVYGHTKGDMPWAHCDECIEAKSAKLVGAKQEEVAIMNGLTVNIHVLLTSFYRPTATRNKILLESKAFPSDHYAIESQIRGHNLDPATCMICMEPREGELTLRTEDILAKIEEEGDSIAVVFFSGVQYYTGQLFDMRTITKAGQEKGCYVGWDLAHAVGNVEIYLHDWGVDFACWCTYKYLNGGAGCIAGAFMHERYKHNDFQKLLGWWGHKMESRFKMDNKMVLDDGLHGYRISNPPIMLCASLEAGLDVFMKTSMPALRAKSKLLTGYLEMLLKHEYPKPRPGETSGAPYVDIITPEDPEQRGSQLSVMFSVCVTTVFIELKRRGVVLDHRKPNVLRLAPTAMYNSFLDVHRFVQVLGVCMNQAALKTQVEN